MSTEQPDIEAFAKTSDVSSLMSALSAAIGEPQVKPWMNEELKIYECKDLLVVLHPSQDDFLGVWIRGRSPWPSSPALARHLADRLRCVVRCDPGAMYPEVDPLSDVFLEIEGHRESLVTWN
jgi:hypothetical protein